MDKEQYRRLTQPGVILNSASRKAIKRYQLNRAVTWFCIAVMIAVFWMFVYHGIRYWLHG